MQCDNPEYLHLRSHIVASIMGKKINDDPGRYYGVIAKIYEWQGNTLETKAGKKQFKTFKVEESHISNLSDIDLVAIFECVICLYAKQR